MNGLTMKYFVLNPNKDDAYGAASRSALLRYANAILPTNKGLSKDINDWLIKIEKRLYKKPTL